MTHYHHISKLCKKRDVAHHIHSASTEHYTKHPSYIIEFWVPFIGGDGEPGGVTLPITVVPAAEAGVIQPEQILDLVNLLSEVLCESFPTWRGELSLLGYSCRDWVVWSELCGYNVQAKVTVQTRMFCQLLGRCGGLNYMKHTVCEGRCQCQCYLILSLTFHRRLFGKWINFQTFPNRKNDCSYITSHYNLTFQRFFLCFYFSVTVWFHLLKKAIGLKWHSATKCSDNSYFICGSIYFGRVRGWP